MKYCIIDNGFPEPSKQVPYGFHQWKNVFNGKLIEPHKALALLKKEDFDIIHFEMTNENLILMEEIKKQLGPFATCKTVGSINQKQLKKQIQTGNIDFLRRISKTLDLITAPEYKTCLDLEGLINKKVIPLSNPIDTNKVKTQNVKKGRKQTAVFILPDSFNGFLKLKIWSRLHLGLKPVFIKQNALSDKNVKSFRNSKEIDSFQDVLQIFRNSKVIFDFSDTNNIDNLSLYAALSGLLTMGTNQADIFKKCYPLTTLKSRNLKDLASKSLWILKNQELKSFIQEQAYIKSEQFNLANSQKKFLDQLHRTSGGGDYTANHKPSGSCSIFDQIEHISGPKRIEYSDEEFSLICLLKNGEEYLPEFYNHYRALGCRHFYFIDNGSSDDTLNILKRFPNTTIYSTLLEHKKYECEIRRVMIEHLCQNKWVLCVDIDEFFDYPNSNKVSMPKLLQYLNSHKYTALVANMLDMFPKTIKFKDKQQNSQIREKHVYYDISNINRIDYYKEFESSNQYNLLPNDQISCLYGGIRETYFKNGSSSYLLIKHPLLFCDGKLEPFTNPHFCNKAKIADVMGVLLHYKFLSSFKTKVSQTKNDYAYFANKEYEAYSEAVAELNELSMHNKHAQVYSSANKLLEQNFLSASERYLNL